MEPTPGAELPPELPQVTMTPVGEPSMPAPDLSMPSTTSTTSPVGASGLLALLPRDGTQLAAVLVFSLALWALPLLLYAHNHSGDPGDSGPLGNLDGLVAGWMGGLLLLLLLPTGLALLVRSRFGYAFGLAVGTCSILWVVFSAPFGFYKLGGVAVLSLLHCALAGAGIIFLLVRPVGRALRRL